MTIAADTTRESPEIARQVVDLPPALRWSGVRPALVVTLLLLSAAPWFTVTGDFSGPLNEPVDVRGVKLLLVKSHRLRWWLVVPVVVLLGSVPYLARFLSRRAQRRVLLLDSVVFPVVLLLAAGLPVFGTMFVTGRWNWPAFVAAAVCAALVADAVLRFSRLWKAPRAENPVSQPEALRLSNREHR